MKTARFEKLRNYIEDAGVPVFENSGAPPSSIPDELCDKAGFPRGWRVQGTYRPGDGLDRGSSIHLNLPDNAPEWLRLGVLAHEYGHHIDRVMGTYYSQGHYERERAASERAYELLLALGIKPTEYVRATFNVSMVSHGTSDGRDVRDIRKDML